MIFLAGILLFTGAAFWLESGRYLSYTWLCVFAAIPLLAMFRSVSVIMDLALVYGIFWLFDGHRGDGLTIWFLPLVSFALLTLAARINSKTAYLLATLMIVWWMEPATLLTTVRDPIILVFALCAVMSVVLSIIPGFRRESKPIRTVDLILCSFSGNTAHITRQFVEGLLSANITVHIHRFHYHKSFNVELNGDALVVAHPVFGWKPPWPMEKYLRSILPRGKGKPAFILNTCAGGPENAHFLPWLWLMVRGYRVLGHFWGTYPVNIPTFRLGPKALWKLMDEGSPNPSDPGFARKCGSEFARGLPTGFPCVVFPFPLIILGLLLDNPWINRIIYRNHAWQRRCTGCGICVKICPEHRLSMVDGFPQAKGTCNLCLSCVNRCPVNAMHMVCWTEYGQQYTAKWPEYLVNSPEDQDTVTISGS